MQPWQQEETHFSDAPRGSSHPAATANPPAFETSGPASRHVGYPRTGIEQAAFFDSASPASFEAMLQNLVSHSEATLARMGAVEEEVKRQGVELTELKEELTQLKSSTAADGAYTKGKGARILANDHKILKVSYRRIYAS